MDAFHHADSLLAYSSSPKELIEALMVSAHVSEKMGDNQNAIDNALKALNEALRINDRKSQANIYMFLAKQFRNIGYLSRVEVFINKAENTISSLNLKEEPYILKGRLFLEKGELLLENKKFIEAIRAFKLAHSLISGEDIDSKLKHSYLAKAEYLLGNAYSFLNQNTLAFKHLNNSLDHLEAEDSDNDSERAWIFNGYANLFLQMDDLVCSEYYFQKSLRIVEGTNCNLLKKSAYGDALNFYRQKNDLDSVAHYSQKYITILTTVNSNQKNIIQSGIWKEEEDLSFAVSGQVLFLGLGIALSGLVFLVYKKSANITVFEQPTTVETQVRNEVFLPIETELEILSRLDEFEKGKKFLNKKMNVSLLVTKLETNAKYLRYILKKHKGKDFNSYINDLRISYIIQKMESIPIYLQYKISYLADEAGFSSHSKFSKVFKKSINCSPSDYIHKIQSSSG